MIDFYTWTTPNGRKVAIMLEEAALDYEAHPVNISKGEQFTPDFLAVSPNNKIPAIVHRDAEGGPVSVFESGAILTYLAEISGRFLPADAPGRARVNQWLHWQIGGFGPMLGQLYHFRNNQPDAGAYAVTRFSEEAVRLFRVLDGQLATSEFVAGNSFSIADMAIYPWAKPSLAPVQKSAYAPFEHVARWMAALDVRPALSRGMMVPAV